MSEVRVWLKEERIVQNTQKGLQVNSKRKIELEKKLNEKDEALGELYQRVFEPVPLDKAREEGDMIFVYPTVDYLLVLVFYPDYIGITTAREILEFAKLARGSQLMDHVIRSLSIE